ncbi:hypothetical protein GIB67_038317 [Kingdonia uniflora]|uniref:Uncharacterized protein n=1 Tax=Kingdonia uniflora TaxID=39325 RepID=A0A7J7KUJ6_9MAGN|nr:hypothetical protein GIB67_038317 [Kingdonia uniflora]
MSIGYYTLHHHLMYNPTVRLDKKKRESFPEVEDPDHVVQEANQFIHHSFFRKIAHIQEVTPDPIRADVYTIKRKAETLKGNIEVDPPVPPHETKPQSG